MLLVSIFSQWVQLEELIDISCKAGLWWTPSTFICLGNPLSSFHFWRIALRGLIFLVDGFSFNSLSKSSHSFLECKVSAEKSAYCLIGATCHVVYDGSCFQNSLSLMFENFIILCLGIDLFRFNLLGILWTSLIWRSFASPELGNS